MKTADSSILEKLEQRYGALFRAAKFGIAGATGFLIAETILTISVFAIYRKLNVNSAAYASPTLLELNILAFGLGTVVAFFLNERITVSDDVRAQRKSSRRKANVIMRLLKFELVYAAGNAVTIGVQIGLLREFGISPSIGSIIGAIVAFPLSYFISMKFVWRISGLESRTSQKTEEDALRPRGGRNQS